MLSKPTPLWVLLGGAALAAVAGAINAVGFLDVQHQAICHLSGTATNLGIDLARTEWALARHAALVIVFFFLGCVLSALIIRHSTLRAGRRYGVALMCEGAALFLATYFFRHGAPAGAYLATLACGLQNAMATSYSGAVVRTTHLTGIVTDLGIAMGLAARRERVDWRRMRLYGFLFGGFFLGGVLGAVGFLTWGYEVLLLPATVTSITGITHTVLQHKKRRHARRQLVTPAPRRAPATPLPLN